MPSKNGLRSQVLALAVFFLASLATAEPPVPGFSGLTTQVACAQEASGYDICYTVEGIYRCNCICTHLYAEMVHRELLTPEQGGAFSLTV